MFDGVGWAAGEIVIFMVIATLIGLGIGWIVGRWLQRDTVAGDFDSQILAEKERADSAEKTIAAGRADLEPPAMVVIGEVVRLRSALDWRGALDGRTLKPDPLGVRTRPRAG